MKSRLLSAFALTLLLSGCSTLSGFGMTTGSSAPTKPTPSSFCLVAKPIYWADGDTDQTIAQVKEHNRVYKTLCAVTTP